MIRFLIRLASFITIQLVILAFVWHYGSPDISDHYLSTMYDKHALLNATDQPRLIFVGGSNVAYGINSEMFKEHLALDPVNLGLNAGLGLRFQLRLVQEGIREGDMVVVIPEYALLTTEAYEGFPDAVAALLERWPEGSYYFEDSQTKSFMQRLDRDGLWLTHLRVRRTRQRLKSREAPSAPNRIYSRHNFNQYGDMVGHYDATAPALRKLDLAVTIDQRYIQQAVGELNHFQSICTARGARVLFCYPPVVRVVFENNREQIEQLDRILTATLKIPIVHAPEEVTYEREFFYDTAYHLNKEGTIRRSELLLNRIGSRSSDLAQKPDPSSRL